MIAGLLFIFGFNDLTIPLDKGVFSGVQAKLVSTDTAIIGLGGPYKSPKNQNKNFTNTYNVLLIRLKKGAQEPEILAKLEISGIKKNRVDSESSHIFELSSNARYLFVKPAESPHLHVVEISPDSLRLASKFNDAFNDDYYSLVSLVTSPFSTKTVLTYLVFDSKKKKEENILLVCDLEKDNLKILGNWRFEGSPSTIYKGCLLGQKYLVLIGTQSVTLFNTETGKNEKQKYILGNIFRFGPYPFLKENCWFFQKDANSIQVFVAPTGGKIIQFETTKDDPIGLKEKDSAEQFGETKGYDQIIGDSNYFVAKKTISREEDELKINATLHWNKTSKYFLTSDAYFFMSPPSIQGEIALVAINLRQEVLLQFLNLGDKP